MTRAHALLLLLNLTGGALVLFTDSLGWAALGLTLQGGVVAYLLRTECHAHRLRLAAELDAIEAILKTTKQ